MEAMSFPQVHMGVDRGRGRSRRNLTLCLVTVGLLFAPLFSFGSEDEVSTLRERIDLAERERAELCKVLGAIYEEVGDTDNAIRIYRMGFQVSPDDVFLCNKLKELCTKEERWGELVLVYESLVNGNPGANESYMKKLAECHLNMGDYEDGVRVMGELLDEYGDTAADYRDAGQMLMTFEQYEAAAGICRKGIEKQPDGSRDLYCMLGRALAKAEKYAEAVVAYEQAIQRSSSERDKRILEEELVELCKDKPVIEEILKERKESLESMDQRLAELYWQKAEQEEKGGNPEAAVALYRKIALLVPDSEKGKAAQEKTEGLGAR
jgi:tetratricopeptide (TPR) repeat protein